MLSHVLPGYDVAHENFAPRLGLGCRDMLFGPSKCAEKIEDSVHLILGFSWGTSIRLWILGSGAPLNLRISLIIFDSKTIVNHSPNHLINRWYDYHSQSWVIYGIVLPTLSDISPTYQQHSWEILEVEVVISWALSVLKIGNAERDDYSPERLVEGSMDFYGLGSPGSIRILGFLA